MEKTSKSLKAILNDLRHPTERSTMFWWLVENHEVIVQTVSGQRIQWATISAHLKELGLKDRDGADPKPNTARMTWFRARKAVQAAKQVGDTQVRASPEHRMPRESDARPLAISHGATASVPETQVAPVSPPPSSSVSHEQGGHTPDTPPVAYVAEPGEGFPTRANIALRRPTDVEVTWTPEQIAHRDAVLARARAQLEYADRFLNLQE